MGALDDLLKQLQEAAEAQQRGQGAPRPAPQPQRQAPQPQQRQAPPQRPQQWQAPQHQRPASTAPAAPRSFANRARREPEPEVVDMPDAPAVAEVAAHNANGPTGRQVLNTPAATSRADQRTEHPLVQRLRQPGGAREAILLSEILRRRQPGQGFQR